MKFRGTGGKWELYTHIDDYETYQYSVTSGNGKVAYCYNMSIADYENKIAKANALLISKAPEILEMLKKVYDSINMQSEIEYCSDTYYEIEQLIKEATEL